MALLEKIIPEYYFLKIFLRHTSCGSVAIVFARTYYLMSKYF